MPTSRRNACEGDTALVRGRLWNGIWSVATRLPRVSTLPTWTNWSSIPAGLGRMRWPSAPCATSACWTIQSKSIVCVARCNWSSLPGRSRRVVPMAVSIVVRSPIHWAAVVSPSETRIRSPRTWTAFLATLRKRSAPAHPSSPPAATYAVRILLICSGSPPPTRVPGLGVPAFPGLRRMDGLVPPLRQAGPTERAQLMNLRHRPPEPGRDVLVGLTLLDPSVDPEQPAIDASRPTEEGIGWCDRLWHVYAGRECLTLERHRDRQLVHVRGRKVPLDEVASG